MTTTKPYTATLAAAGPRLLCANCIITLPRPMKSERRHELKTNSLAKGMTTFPALLQQYGSRVLLGVVLCLLVYILVYRYTTGKSQRATVAADSLSTARQALNSLRNPPSRLPPAQLAELRDQASKEAEGAIRDAIANAEDPKVKAEALIAQGDLNWLLANFPALPTTAVISTSSRPEKSNEELLKASEDAYREVLQPPLNADHQAVTTARFGMAAIAENRHQWVEARKYYQQIVDDPATPDAFKTQATLRLEMSKKLEKPVMLGGPPKAEPLGPAMPPATFPSATAPSTTAPSTQPAADLSATTAPAAGPATRPAAPASPLLPK